jgi:hypothetical protein
MLKLSQFVNMLIVGNPAFGISTTRLYGCTISGADGTMSNIGSTGSDLMVSTDGTLAGLTQF